mmetsp:Transcript_615/g.894  ORF Transcript_615/g.894 Transcript_615/m.894 type:complete len:215 (+) Transcript_615:46-690(+)|eukprot:CAMPEP_0184520190 /NCGR_PEP_ID=MMETSP0198_2-20121128/7030_1 /TAXON_ID=1112570 /ORGANISM="Thraustochytrium sp., Strain LLF1b" /LENGTH=214 /DNA_ID=CAMNT_0026910761 /DNA_START=49 /DNA_END=693 /DNA_ORIENTATION=-
MVRVVGGVLGFAAVASAACFFGARADAFDEYDDEFRAKELWDLEVTLIDGSKLQMGQFEESKVILVANVASECGFTNSGYEQLVQLDQRYRDQGLEILAAPCNQFGGQEPGTPEEIQAFAKSFGADFRILEKLDVNGPDRHPLYKYLLDAYVGEDEGDIKWNFEYFLIEADGFVLERWRTGTDMLSPEVTEAIEESLIDLDEDEYDEEYEHQEL